MISTKKRLAIIKNLHNHTNTLHAVNSAELLQIIPNKNILNTNINNLIALEEKLKTGLKAPKTNNLFLFKSQPIQILKEIIWLLKDYLNGEIKNYLKEIIDSAEFDFRVGFADVEDPDSRKILTINIKIASTIIDKYSTLLSKLLEHDGMPLNANDEQLITETYHKLINNSQEIKRLAMHFSLMKLNSKANEHIETHTLINCWCNNSRSKRFTEIINWFERLTMEPLAIEELVGAIYSIRAQITIISNKKEQHALRDTLDQILKKNHYPHYTKSIDHNYMEEFAQRARYLNISWPSGFQEQKNLLKAPLLSVS